MKALLKDLEEKMVFVKGTTQPFTLEGRNWDSFDEVRKRKVMLSDFFLCKYPVTQQLWEAVMGENPSYFKGAKRPVEQISWDDVQVFIQKLNEISKSEGGKFVYHLPSEAQWEYAARDRVQADADKFEYAGGNRLEELGWFRNNSNNETKTVGQKLPNTLGLYDMSGNVWEWCADLWRVDYEYGRKDGKALFTGRYKDLRVFRGGGWDNSHDYCRVSVRDCYEEDSRSIDIGCRLLGTLI